MADHPPPDDDGASILRARSLGPRPALLDRPRGEAATWEGAVRGLLSTLGVEEQPLPEPGADGLHPNPVLMGSRRAAAAFPGLPERVTADEYRRARSAMGIAMGFSDGGVAGVTRRVAAPIRTYHGSPHQFDAFDFGKIGTGEGAQSYGHGLYVAESERLGGRYREQLAGRHGLLLDGNLVEFRAPANALSPEQRAAVRVHAAGGNQKKAIRELREGVADLPPGSEARLMDEATLATLRQQSFTGRIEPFRGHLYEVDLHAPRDRLLDFDRPLSEQPGPVRDTFAERGFRPVEVVGGFEKGESFGRPQWRLRGADGSAVVATDNGGQAGFWITLYDAEGREVTRRPIQAGKENMADAMRGMVRQDLTGEDAYWRFAERLGRGADRRYGPDGRAIDRGAPAASEDLRRAGVEGVSYLDGFSRGTAEGTRNHVAFSDGVLEILKRYGLAGIVGGGASALADGGEAAPAH